MKGELLFKEVLVSGQIEEVPEELAFHIKPTPWGNTLKLCLSCSRIHITFV